MRDEKRLDKFYNELNKIHKEYFTDWRFGQFIFNFMSWMNSEKKIDIFFPEEDIMIEYIKEYANTHSKYRRG